MTVALLTGTATGVLAAPSGGPGDRFPIPVEDVEARQAEIFARMDSDGDGRISTEEFAAAKGPHGHRAGMKPPRPMGDGRGRGKPSEEEIAAMDDAIFETLDADGNEVLSRSEFSHQAMTEARTNTMKAHFFAKADANGDGYLSPEEFPPGRRLADLDANGDGLITRDELPRRSSDSRD
jgi:Ca2+-binding EF-hand superfamily protein